ncbi:Pycsar system effector family protein [Streptomyces sp. NPDC048483]|uniref:Pycsar system effector family protein n=1 Tax=Streptomyces sp. NPDC048483 TaxID=3154927 RepID=UPI003418D416
MFVEVQRADGKATALCGVAGGLLAVAGAALAALPDGARLPAAALACACLLLGLALSAAVSAIRPVLPGDRAFTGLEGICRGSTAEDVVAAFQAMGRLDQLRMEADRLAVLASLARRKFRAIKVAVDLIVTAILVAGMGLLITYISA